MGRVLPIAPLRLPDRVVLRLACRLAALWLCVAGLSPVDAAERSATATAAVNELREAITELRREEKTYRAFRASAKKDNPELDDYAAFIARLQLRVYEQCEVVRAQIGEEGIRAFDCVRLSPNRASVGTVPSASVQTEEEKQAGLNARLNAIEGDVDDSLQKRQQEIRQRQAASTAGGGGGRGGAAGTSDGAAGTPGAPGQPGQSGTSAGQTAAGSSSPDREQRPSAAYGRPGRTDAPTRQPAMDGASDDDVVARQLREAAEREADPVLKEKLWAEYKKYREARR
jgi:hypothetical protein